MDDRSVSLRHPWLAGRVTDLYVHGYDRDENARLEDQARALLDLLHVDTVYPSGSRVLEVGCGVGAQTTTLLRRSPDAHFTCIDISHTSLAKAVRRTDEVEGAKVGFCQADLFALPFAPRSFDHIFVCFVLEHLERPVAALGILRQMLRGGGTITVIEGDHGSAYFHPANVDAQAGIECLIRLQEEAGGNALIGRQLYPLLIEAGFDAVRVAPRMVYVDGNRPDLAEGFTRKTFTAMVQGVRHAAIGAGLVTPEAFEAGIRALHRTAEPDGVFCYTFFKGVGEAPPVMAPYTLAMLAKRV